MNLSLDPKVYALIKESQANKSAYIERLIIQDFKDKKQDRIVEAVKSELLGDPDFVKNIRFALAGNSINEDFSEPESYA